MISEIYVTTTHKTNKDSIDLAKRYSEILNVPYLPRNRMSFEDISRDKEDVGFLVVSKTKQLTLVYNENKLFFHPNMSKVRIKSLRNGKNDPMLTAMSLKEGDRVLDCTLGLGSDAIVTSYAVGPCGKVVGLEAEAALALIVKQGLEQYMDSNVKINEAMRRIEVKNLHHLEYLSELPENSYDVVYFDPMFRKPIHKSSSMQPMRDWVNKDPLTAEAISQAKRVAAKKVVMKESRSSEEFQRLSFDNVVGGKNSPIAYGVINLE